MPDTLEALPCGPSLDGADTGFWEGLREGELRLPRCEACRTWRPLGRALCSRCWSFDTAWEGVPPVGTVYTWVRSHRAFMSELDVDAPYVTALVELDAAPVRLLGIVLDAERDIAIGDAVHGEIHQPANAAWPILRWRLA